MGCTELLHILERDKTQSAGENSLADHVRTCRHCRHGLIRLPGDPPANCPDPVLTCDQCLKLLPNFYEATHPDSPLVTMPEQELLDVVIHLTRCDMCYEVYEDFVAVAEMEENDV